MSEVSPTTNAERARVGRFFYLVGGDPGRVPTTLNGTPVWTAILEAWLGGAALAGSSAGAHGARQMDADPRPAPR